MLERLNYEIKVNILVPEQIDSHIEYILKWFCKKYQMLNIIKAKLGVNYLVNRLIVVDNCSYLTDHSLSCMIGDVIILSQVLSFTKKWVGELKKEIINNGSVVIKKKNMPTKK